jgi:hypothetical protein
MDVLTIGYMLFEGNLFAMNAPPPFDTQFIVV